MTGRRLRPVPPPVVLRNLEPLSECVECAKVQIARWILGESKAVPLCTHRAPTAEDEIPRGGQVVEMRSA